MDAPQVARLILAEERHTQDGVVTWAQLRAGGWSESDIRREVRRQRLRLVHPRVYVDHTGPLTWSQRRWAAVLWAAPAALCGDSTTNVAPTAGTPVHVAVDHSRRLRAVPDGVVVHRVRGLSSQLSPINDPPRLSRADNALLVAGLAGDDWTAIAAVAEAVSAGVTGAQLSRALERHPRLRRHRLLVSVAADLGSGAHSVLEHLYLTRVERAHGLPAGRRQVTRAGVQGAEYRDVAYPEFHLVVELDGKLNHSSWTARQRDAQRDLDDAAEGHTALRLTWAQVAGSPCRTADRLARILRARGWQGPPRPCGPDCARNRGA